MKIYVPLDSTAKALGADEIADAIVVEAGARGLTVEVIRNGTRCMIWLEPLVEIETENGRVGYARIVPSYCNLNENPDFWE
jgi:formate dehydrogenase iron-sulfur subunit